MRLAAAEWENWSFGSSTTVEQSVKRRIRLATLVNLLIYALHQSTSQNALTLVWLRPEWQLVVGVVLAKMENGILIGKNLQDG